MTYTELLADISGRKPTYEELLLTTEWLQKRNEITMRDGERCKVCKRSQTFNNPPHWQKDYEYIYEDTSNSSTIKFIDPMSIFEEEHEIDLSDINPVVNFKTSDVPISLHVHHKLYFKGRLPWNYEDFHLVTVCDRCHIHFHQKHKVKVYDEFSQELSFTCCDRCNGAGWISEYSHVQNGICFKCYGERFTTSIV